MLNNKKVNIIISLLIATVLWVYVVGEINPAVNKTFRDLPVRYINQASLENKGMAVASISATNINITVRGDRSRINKLEASDISASVDISDAAKGENEFKVGVKVPDNISVENKSLNKVIVKVETLVSEEREVRTVYDGEFKNGTEGLTLSSSVANVAISGAKSNVAKVKYVRALVEGNKLSKEPQDYTVNLVPVDSHGNIVNYVHVSEERAVIKAQLGKTKDVELEVPIVGQDDKSKEKTIKVPKSITIKGAVSVLDGIDKITAETINLAEITESTSVDIIPILPEGVEVSEKSQKMKAEVTVVALETKAFSYEGNEVKFNGLASGLNARIDQKISVSVSGKKAQIGSITKEDIALSVDLSKLDVGVHQISLDFDIKKDHVTATVEPSTVIVSIE